MYESVFPYLFFSLYVFVYVCVFLSTICVRMDVCEQAWVYVPVRGGVCTCVSVSVDLQALACSCIHLF